MALGLIEIFSSHVVIFVHLLHVTSVSKYLCDTVLCIINLRIFSVIYIMKLHVFVFVMSSLAESLTLKGFNLPSCS